MKTLLMVFLTVSLLVFFTGCGDTIVVDGSGSGGGSTYYDGATVDVVIEGYSFMTFADINANGTVSPKGIYDTADVSCFFLTPAVTPLTGIDIVSNADNCTDKNKCIVCTKTGGASCSIECTGTVPSNSDTALDYVEITYKANSIFTTDMRDPATILRFDGSILDWPEMDPSAGIFWTDTNCDGNSLTGLNQTEMDADENDPLGIKYEGSDGWSTSWSIVDYGNVQECWLEQRFTANMYLSGAEISGNTVDLTRGTIDLSAMICDSSLNCSGP